MSSAHGATSPETADVPGRLWLCLQQPPFTQHHFLQGPWPHQPEAQLSDLEPTAVGQERLSPHMSEGDFLNACAWTHFY